MFTVGITGGVGAGKSTVMRYLAERCQAQIIEADAVAKELMQPGGATYAPLLALLGTDVLAADGTIDRARMAARLYASEELGRQVNAVVHPAVRRVIEKRLGETDAPLAVIEAALLAEGGLLPLCDTVWYIYADEPTRIRRLMAARGYSEERCRAIIGRQKSEKDFAAIADHTVDNSGSPEETERQIRQLLAVCPGREV